MVNKSVLSVLVSLGMLMTSLPFGGGVGGSSAGGGGRLVPCGIGRECATERSDDSV